MTHSKNVINCFTDYYETQFWGNKSGSSGPNSAYDTTFVLRENLEKIFKKLKIKSILDLGCGDCNLFKYLNLNLDFKKINYLGLDCVESLIKLNQNYFKDLDKKINKNINYDFEVLDISQPNLKFKPAQLALCRDVVHYLPNQLIFNLLNNIFNSDINYLLITHNLYSDLSANDPTEIGIFRPVNLCCAPFNFPEPDLIIEEDTYGKTLGLWKLDSIKLK